ncbi:MAG: hypothetical protein ABH865_09480 [Candidatus Omnitrophota bacterium]|nr:hypothetical protein [Candidatus Omnitrophota bacterium]
MEEKALRNNYLFTLIKFILFLLIFCFLASFSKEFLYQIRLDKALRVEVLLFSVLSCFAFYAFFVDLDNFYKAIQKFFFHSSFIAMVIPSFLILLGIGYFLIPRVFELDFDRDVFLFLGGFIVTAHLIFVARQNRGSNFVDFINYIFIFSILYLVNLLLFGVYLNVAFRVDMGAVIVEGFVNGATLIQSLFTQIFQR